MADRKLRTAVRRKPSKPTAGVRMTRLTPVDATRPPVRPAYWAYLRACIHLIEAGKPVTQINLSRELQISPQAVWKFLKRWPGVLTFVDDELRASNQKYFGLVQRRMAIGGMQGSPVHAEIFFKSEAGHYTRSLSTDLPGVLNVISLVPRPETPGLVSGPGPGSPTTAASFVPRPPLAGIPTVTLR